MGARKVQKSSDKWKAAVKSAGGKEQYIKTLVPKCEHVAKKSARRTFAQKMKAHSGKATAKAKAKAKGGSSSKPGSSGGSSGSAPAAPWTGSIQWTSVADHEMHGKEIAFCRRGQFTYEHLGQVVTIRVKS